MKQRASGVVCEKHMKIYTFYLKHLRCFLLGTCFLLFASQAKAQAPDNIKGLFIETTITSGASPLASSGKWVALPSAVNNEFALVPITLNVAPTFGTYSYSKVSGTRATLILNSTASVVTTVDVTFSTSELATYTTTSSAGAGTGRGDLIITAP